MEVPINEMSVIAYSRSGKARKYGEIVGMGENPEPELSLDAEYVDKTYKKLQDEHGLNHVEEEVRDMIRFREKYYDAYLKDAE